MEVSVENLKTAIEQIVESDGKLLIVIDQGKDSIMPEFCIRYMNTAGGFQLCLKEVTFQGEGGGLYEQYRNIDWFCSLVMQAYGKLLKREDFKRRFFKSHNKEFKERTFELRVQEHYTRPPIPFNSVPFPPFMEDATTFNL